MVLITALLLQSMSKAFDNGLFLPGTEVRRVIERANHELWL